MKWVKKGLIFAPNNEYEWMSSHAASPFAEKVEGTRYRIYFSPRDRQNRSHIAYIDVDINNPQKILEVSKKPLLKPGKLGAFDDSGAMASWVINHKNKKFMYYIGWSLGITVPFYCYIGLAISIDNGNTFKRFSESPILGRSKQDLYLTTTPCILIDGKVWRMWYTSGVRWELEGRKPKHYYHIRYAESQDGINWNGDGTVCIDFKSKDEYAIARPCVIKEDGIYKMWYSYRGRRYKIGYAESKDGIKWTRKDSDINIDISPCGWDSKMVCYPFVFTHNGKKYMLYNGNDYSRTGFGYAVLE